MTRMSREFRMSRGLSKWFGMIAMVGVAASPMSVAAAEDATGAKHVPSDQERPRIINGKPASEGAWPWQVSIIGTSGGAASDLRAGHSCGGTVISGGWILTAAHCVYENEGRRLIPADRLQIFMGSKTLPHSADDLPPQTYDLVRVRRVIPHPDFNWGTRQNDLAILRLERPPIKEVVHKLRYARWPKKGDAGTYEKSGLKGIITGWGATETESVSDKLLQADVTLVSQAECQTNYAQTNDPDVVSTMICAGTPINPDAPNQPISDSCQGDSGGPLIVEVGGRYRQVGVVSWGGGCAVKGLYGVYTRLSAYGDWIDRVLLSD